MKVVSHSPFRLVIASEPDVSLVPLFIVLSFALLFGLNGSGVFGALLFGAVLALCGLVFLAFRQWNSLAFDRHLGTVEHRHRWSFGKRRVVYQLEEVFGAHVVERPQKDAPPVYEIALILTGMDEGLYHFDAPSGTREEIQALADVINTWLRDVDLAKAEA